MNESVAIEMAIRARRDLSAMDDTIRKVREMKRRFANMARSVIRYAQKISAAVAKMKAAFIKLNNALRTLRNVALKAFTALVALTGIPIYKFAKFEQAMANVNTLVDTSAKKFRELEDGVVSVSNRVGESAESLSTALYDIVSAGVDAGNSIGVLDLSARAAAAGMTDAQTAVNAGISTINAYNLEISKLNKVFDLQFQTVRKGVITYEELSSAQGELLPSARKLNESLENMYGSLAFVTKNGLSAESASTSLARAYDGLIQKSNELAQAGVEVYDEFGKFRGIIDIVEDLSDKLEGLSDKEMQDVLQGIGFEVRAARAIIPMVNNIDGLRESVDAMGDSAGSMQAAFEEATDTIQFRFNRAKERIVNSMIAIGRTFRTEINSMLDNVGAWALAIQGFVSQNKEAIKSMLTFALKLTGVIAVFASVGVAIMGLMTPIGAVSAAIALFGGLWYLNMWDIRDKTDKAISKIIELWGSLQESTKNTVDYSLKEWNKFKDWWQNTTWIEKVQDIGEIALNVGGWAWDNTGEPIVQSLWNWIKDKFDKNDDEKITFDEVLEVAIDVTVGGFNAVGDIANKLNNWVQQNLFPSDGSIEEQIEREMGNSGIGELLKAVYRAEGGKDASALYGTTWFKENGHKFGKQANQEFFEGLVESMGIEKDSQGWYAASSATTINHYWDNFKDNYELAADQTLASLSEDMQDKFIKYLGSNYSPTKGNLTPAEEKLNKNWIPNVSEFYNSEMLNQISASDIKESVTSKINLTPIFEVTLEGANTAIEAIADFLGWIHEEGIAYNIGNILAKIALGIAEFKLKTIAKIITDVLDIDLEKGEMAANIGKLTINVLKVGWNFMQGVSDGFWEKLTGKNSAELGQDTNNWIDLNLNGNADKVEPHIAKATGGYISGPGTSTSDSIPAMLSNGEYVINAASTSRWRPILEAINSGNFEGFRNGGGPGGPDPGLNQYVPPDVANEWALKAAGIEGDFSSKMLNALTGIAKDTKNFQHVVDLVSGIEEMKKAYQETLENNESDLQDAIDQLEKDLKDLENEGEKFNANLSNLTSELSSFANNIANITGSEEAGLVSSLIGSGKGMYDQYQNFKKSDDWMSQMTSGFGIMNAGLSIVGAIQSYNQKENEEILAEYQKQLEVDRDQLNTLQSIKKNTEDTAKNIIKAVAQNPTNQNVTLARSQVEGQANFMLRNRPNFGNVDITGYDQDRWWHGKEREHHSYSLYDTARRLGKDVSMFSGYGGNVMNLPFERLEQFERQFSSITVNQVKRLKGGIDEGFSTDLRTVQAQLRTYVDTVSALKKVQNNIAESSRLESFEGINYISQAEALEQYKEQLKETYKAAGYTSAEIRRMDGTITNIARNLARTTNNIVTIMQTVRSSFISTFADGNSMIDSFTQGLSGYFDTLKNNISSMVYNLDLSGLDTYFENLFESINIKLANYSGSNPLEYAEKLISGSNINSGFSKIIDMYENSGNMNSINEMLANEFREQAEASGLGDSEIADLIEQLGLAADEAANELREFAGETKNAPSGFKQERFGYEAVDSRRVTEKTTISGNTFIIKSDSAEEIIKEIRRLDKNAKLQKTGTPAGTLEGG